MEPVTFPIAENSDYIWFCIIMVVSATLVDLVMIMLMRKGQIKGRFLTRTEKVTYGILTVLITIVFYLGAIEVYLQSQGSVTVAEDHIHVENGMMYTTDFAFEDLNIDATQIVNIYKMGELFPAHRRNGTALGDLWAGKFRTKNGTDAYLLVSDPENSVMLEHQNGRVIYLSPNDPRVFLNLVMKRGSK